MTSRFSVIRNSNILVPRGRARFSQHQESRPLAASGFFEHDQRICFVLSQSGLSDLTLNMRAVRESRISVVGPSQRSGFSVLKKKRAASGKKIDHVSKRR